VPLVGEILQQRIQHLHAFAGDVLGHGRPPDGDEAASYIGHDAPQVPDERANLRGMLYCGGISSISDGSLFLTLPTRALTGQQIISPE
jgi:hypothetical protein